MCMLKMIFIKYDRYFVGQVWFFNHLIKVTNPTCAVMLLEGGKVGKRITNVQKNSMMWSQCLWRSSGENQTLPMINMINMIIYIYH